MNTQAYAYAQSYPEAFNKHLDVYSKQHRSYKNAFL